VRMFEEAGQPGPLIEFCRAILARDAKAEWARVKLGETLLAAGKPAEAAAELRTAVEQAPQDVHARARLSDALEVLAAGGDRQPLLQAVEQLRIVVQGKASAPLQIKHLAELFSRLGSH